MALKTCIHVQLHSSNKQRISPQSQFLFYSKCCRHRWITGRIFGQIKVSTDRLLALGVEYFAYKLSGLSQAIEMINVTS